MVAVKEGSMWGRNNGEEDKSYIVGTGGRIRGWLFIEVQRLRNGVHTNMLLSVLCISMIDWTAVFSNLTSNLVH